MNKQSKLFSIIGVLVGVIVVVSAFEFPIVPFAFAYQAKTAPSTSCTVGPSYSTLHLNALKVDSNVSLSLVNMQNVTHWQRINQSNRYIAAWSSITNQTFVIDVQGVQVRGLDGTAAKANFQYWVNGTLDSYLYAKGVSVTTTKPDATTRKVVIGISHLELLVGPEIAKNLNTPHSYPQIPEGLNVSFDNFRLAVLYDCKSGVISFVSAGSTSLATPTSMVGAFLKQA